MEIRLFLVFTLFKISERCVRFYFRTWSQREQHTVASGSQIYDEMIALATIFSSCSFSAYAAGNAISIVNMAILQFQT